MLIGRGLRLIVQIESQSSCIQKLFYRETKKSDKKRWKAVRGYLYGYFTVDLIASLVGFPFEIAVTCSLTSNFVATARMLGATKLAKTLRILKFVRFLKFVRLVKFKKIMDQVSYNKRQFARRNLIRVVTLVVVTLLVTHFSACLFIFVGSSAPVSVVS